MKRLWTIIGVRDVPASFKWYQSLFGQPAMAPEHDYFGQILDADGTVLLCLHQWGAHEHPSLRSPDESSPGNGLLLFFRVDDYDKALNRARALVARFEEEPHVNPNTQTSEFSLRDLDGYYVTISAISPTEAGMTSRRVETSTPANTPVPIGPYNHIAKVGQFISIGGTAGFDPAAGQLAGPGVYAQAKQILASFAVMLESVASGLSHVIHVNVFLKDMRDFEEMNRAYVEMMGDHRPARTVIGVSELPKPGVLLTMNLTAVTKV